MQKTAKFIVTGNRLQVGPSSIRVGSPEWYTWLSEHDRFSFQGENGRFTAQSEMRRNKTYWYAYRRRNGKLFKLYLGKAEELSPERMQQASLTLAGQNFLEAYAGHPGIENPSDIEARIDTSLLPMRKVNIPALPLQLVTRPRLNRQINSPLTLIYAPSGFGKSTLVNDWRQTCGRPVAWLSLDESDNHAIRFWRSVILALQTIAAGFGGEKLNDLHTASPIHLGEVVSRLTDEIVSGQTLSQRFGLVLDDFQHIQHPELCASIQAWLERLAPNMQLIIVGRTKPPLALGGLRAKGFVTELDAGDLRFTLEEGIHYLQQYPYAPPLAASELEKLVKHTEGWAAGLTLTALALGKQEDRRQFIDTFSGAHIYLREYFMETVLQRSSPEVQTFLLKTAVLKHLSGGLCDALTGQTGSQALLARLWHENLFIVRLEEQGWYRYHDLFAEMLLSLLHTRLPGEAAQLHRRAAQWYCEQHSPADAVYHLLAIEAWDEAASLMETMALRELEQYGEDSRLLRWLQELPENVVQKHKTLLFVYLRLADVALPRQKIEGFVARIEANLSQLPAAQRSQDEHDVLVEIQHIRQIWEQGNLFTPPARGDGEHDARWEVLNGLHLLKRSDDPNPQALEKQIAALFQKAQAGHNLFVVLMVGGVLANRAYISGQLRRSEKIARQVLDQALAQRGKLPEPASIALAALSQVYLERNELGLAQRTLSQAGEVDPNPTSTNMLVQTGILRSLLLAAQGKADEALTNLQGLRALHSQRPSAVWSDQDLLAYQVVICLRQGDLSTAEQLLSAAEGGAGHPLSQLAQAEIWLESGQAGAAEKQLSQLITQYPNGISSEPLMRARLLLARALLEQHKTHQALQVITEAVRLAAPERFLRPFLESGARCMPLLLLALKSEKLSAEAQNFIQKLLRSVPAQDYAQVSPPEIEALSASASISQREREVLDLLSYGCTNGEIAEKLCISASTVKTHLGHIYEKLGVNSRGQAMKRARELKLIQ